VTIIPSVSNINPEEACLSSACVAGYYLTMSAALKANGDLFSVGLAVIFYNRLAWLAAASLAGCGWLSAGGLA